MLDLNGTTIETDLRCAQDFSGFGGEGPSCAVAINDRLNERVLRYVLESETLYTLWIYDKYAYGESDRSLRKCSPFTLSIKLTLINLAETIINCAGE